MLPNYANKREAYLVVRGGLGGSLPALQSSLSTPGQKAVKKGRQQASGNFRQLSLQATQRMRDASRLLLPRSTVEAADYAYLPFQELPRWCKEAVLALTAAKEQEEAGEVDHRFFERTFRK